MNKLNDFGKNLPLYKTEVKTTFVADSIGGYSAL